MVDTIAAVATGVGGAVGIVRISGPEAEFILKKMFSRPEALNSHVMAYGRIIDADGVEVDEVMAVLMKAPRSYTREDVAEINCHGGEACVRAVLKRAFELGARPAQPGEFTRRAFVNGRIDLSRAEAVMELVGADSEAARRATLRQLEGGVSGFVNQVSEILIDQMSGIEASIDFPEEVDEVVAAEQVAEGIRRAVSLIEKKIDERSAHLIRDGASVVISGRPNVGKSSIMNALIDQERAIVTNIPGTTRDVLTEKVTLGGVSVELSDTAGLRETGDLVEAIGVDRARKAIELADVVLLVMDASESPTDEELQMLENADSRYILCINKTDLAPVPDFYSKYSLETVELSALTGRGVSGVVDAISRRVTTAGREDILTVDRHIGLAREALEILTAALNDIQSGCDLDNISISIREAMDKLMQITGLDVSESVIDRIFERFCVGK